MVDFDRLIARCKALKHKSQGNHRHFSFLLRKNKIMSFGMNHITKTHPLVVKYEYPYPFIHSELSSIVRFPGPSHELRNCTLVNIRLGKRNDILLSRPCRCCQKIIVAFSINKVVYSNEYGLFEEFNLP